MSEYMIQKMRAKLHNGVVTGANLDYEGSITIGKTLLQSSGIEAGERVQVLNITTGQRIETYVIPGREKEIWLNGAAAHHFKVGDKVIIIAYALITRYTQTECYNDPKVTVVVLNGTPENLIQATRCD